MRSRSSSPCRVFDRAPDYLARYMVRDYLQGLLIDTSGETIDIDALSGEINFGPVTFKGADGETGQIGLGSERDTPNAVLG